MALRMLFDNLVVDVQTAPVRVQDSRLSPISLAPRFQILRSLGQPELFAGDGSPRMN